MIISPEAKKYFLHCSYWEGPASRFISRVTIVRRELTFHSNVSFQWGHIMPHVYFSEPFVQHCLSLKIGLQLLKKATSASHGADSLSRLLVEKSLFPTFLSVRNILKAYGQTFLQYLFINASNCRFSKYHLSHEYFLFFEHLLDLIHILSAVQLPRCRSMSG